ncbi:MAG TPA: toll/interleukin-1 receptor domain-containing protein [Pyrinomonadaceae bacterium]|nr:toll/interleukin-1 receptor domain-containing protein [Pyrinomonadaceae bacterium]
MSSDHQGTPICFVVMGFGKKTDYETGRILDLEKTYRNIIKPAVTEAGLKCVRADEIAHSGLIDVPTYELLLTAEVVIADLSTSDPHVLYELGLRHAFRPFTTIVISDIHTKRFPFPENHVPVWKYEHLGYGIDFGEVERFRRVLREALYDAASSPEVDSPAYKFINKLQPPSPGEPAGAVPRPEPDARRKGLAEISPERHSTQLSPEPADAEVAESSAQGDEHERVRDLIFFSYSHNERDRKILEEIQKTLSPLFQDQTIQMWDDGHIEPGQDWEKEIKQALARAKGAVLIVSRDFLNSTFISKEELPVILQAVEEEGIKLMWVAAEKSFVTKKISKYQALHNPNETLDSFSGKTLNKKIFEVCEKIAKLIFPGDS